MLNNSCKELREKCELALRELREATLAEKPFIREKTINQLAGYIDGDAWSRQRDRLESAWEKWKKAEFALNECIKKYKQE